MSTEAGAGAGAQRAVVELRGVDRVYLTDKVETRALAQVSLDIRRGEYLLVQGPSGSGKSTLLSILGLLDRPTRGEYRLGGMDTARLGLTARARLRNRELGFVFQSFNLIDDLTVADNVELPLRYRRGADRVPNAERRERTNAVLADVGIAHRADHYPAQLSGGQQQRAALARALVGEPSLLLADEPTGNLDSTAENAVMELFADCHGKGTTLCVVSHNPRFEQVAGRVLRLDEGRLVS